MNTLVVEGHRASTNWGISRTGIHGTHFTVEARRWLHVVSRRILPSSNVTDVTYVRALVLAYILSGVRVNVGLHILEE